ncbi:hypothetical protein MUP01_10695 [Candidatus Bathyarchaeota archaeon]|nr:hypothetical protein [Candidatus Bathyarchaeota archaeon]
MTQKTLTKFQRNLKEKQRTNIRKGMSRLFTQMSLSKAAKGVRKAKSKKQFKVYASVARGWYKAYGGLANPKTRRAVRLANKLEKQYNKVGL